MYSAIFKFFDVEIYLIVAESFIAKTLQVYKLQRLTKVLRIKVSSTNSALEMCYEYIYSVFFCFRRITDLAESTEST